MTMVMMMMKMATTTTCLATRETTRETRASSPSLVSAQTTDARFLVRFDAYANVSAHETTTTRALEANANANANVVWRVVSRAKTAASRAPTDFVVVERVGARRRSRSGTCATTKSVGDDELETLRATMRGVARDVHREQRFTKNRRATLSAVVEEEENGGNGRRRLRVSGESIASKLRAE